MKFCLMLFSCGLSADVCANDWFACVYYRFRLVGIWLGVGHTLIEWGKQTQTLRSNIAAIEVQK